MKTDKEVELEYRQIAGLDFVTITPKNRKVKLAIILKGKDRKYWEKLSSKQLSGLLKSK